MERLLEKLPGIIPIDMRMDWAGRLYVKDAQELREVLGRAEYKLEKGNFCPIDPGGMLGTPQALKSSVPIEAKLPAITDTLSYVPKE